MKKLLALVLCVMLVFALSACEELLPSSSAKNEEYVAQKPVDAVERRCAEYLMDNFDLLHEDELSVIYDYLNYPEDFESNALAVEAVETMWKEIDELNAAVMEMYRGEIEVYD